MALKVIGAGFGRTGTASLKLALEKLGFGPCYHMSEVLANAGHMDLWNEVAAGKPDWDAIFKDYAATTDFPASIYWRELAAFYPDAKIVLSLRDAERWIDSTQETILSPKMMGLIEGTPWRAMLRKTVDAIFDGDIHDHDTLRRVFNEHNAAVKAAFGPDRLLVFEAKQGWAPLCAFLGVPVPDEDFPRVNSKEELQGMIAMLESDMGRDMMQGKGMPQAMREQVFGKD
ncbi:sulfotransferase family protein [Hyphococcus luteus]|uniref:sulfotransferase family protein n=1 Tax=Hyphococcus luteus TaxID=2058213 RepID=UPI0013FD9506|nr:sulfotransferase family protein [Marinicaulis flavus]